MKLTTLGKPFGNGPLTMYHLMIQDPCSMGTVLASNLLMLHMNHTTQNASRIKLINSETGEVFSLEIEEVK